MNTGNSESLNVEIVSLTPAETRACNELILADAGDKELAEHLGISVCTLREHLQVAKAKLGARTRAGLAVKWHTLTCGGLLK